MSRAAFVASVVLLCFSASTESFAEPPITVRVYDSTARSQAERGLAIRAAAAIFAEAGLRMSWRDCSRDGADYPCGGIRLPHDLVVRILTRASAADAPSSNAVTAAAGSAAAPGEHLGFAAVTSPVQGGIVATVYAEHVGRVIARTGLAFDLLLGRAIAHEVGHLLPGGSGHTSTGLMRAVWTDDELRRGRAEDWTYFIEVTPTTRSSGSTVDGSSGAAPGRAPFD
jgi:hypothetical protein